MIHIPKPVVAQMVNDVLEHDPDVSNVNYSEVSTSLVHGDKQLFAVEVYVDTENSGSEYREYTVSLELKQRDLKS